MIIKERTPSSAHLKKKIMVPIQWAFGAKMTSYQCPSMPSRRIDVSETFSVKLCHSRSKMATYVTLPDFENKSLVIIYNMSALNP